jgi:predicted ATP-grasp superfamily ATP-dependent carboligase
MLTTKKTTTRPKSPDAKKLVKLIETFNSHFENSVDVRGLTREAMAAAKTGADAKQIEDICRRYLADAFCESLRLTAAQSNNQ